MTMYRRPLGRARVLAIIAAIVLVVGCILPWWTSGGPNGLPVTSGNAFEGSGILVFIVAMATLALVTLPYASGDRPVRFEGWVSYLLLAVIAWLGLIGRTVDLAMQGAFVFRTPEEVISRGAGLPVVVIGMIILSEAVFEMARERRD